MLGKVYLFASKVLKFLCFNSLAIFFSLSACSLYKTEQAASPANTTQKTVQQQASKSSGSAVEIVWEANTTDIDKYHLYYGYSPEQLEFTKLLEVKDLKRYDDPIMGVVYKTILNNIPADKDLYFALQAENSQGLSPRSAVMLVPKN